MLVQGTLHPENRETTRKSKVQENGRDFSYNCLFNCVFISNTYGNETIISITKPEATTQSLKATRTQEEYCKIDKMHTMCKYKVIMNC